MKNFKDLLFRSLVSLIVIIITFLMITNCKSKGNKQTEGIIFPKEDQCVQKGYVQIKWNPKAKPMVVQYYQADICMLNCDAKPSHSWSGDSIQINAIGRTEIKIWEPGDSEPFSSIWIYVENSCQ